MRNPPEPSGPSRLPHTEEVLQRIMQTLGPEAVCECAGCSWETNEAIRLLNSIGIVYQPRGEKRMQHNVEVERCGNETVSAGGPSRLRALLQELVDRYTKRQPVAERHGGCGWCGGLPHSRECLVGRAEEALVGPVSVETDK